MHVTIYWHWKRNGAVICSVCTLHAYARKDPGLGCRVELYFGCIAVFDYSSNANVITYLLFSTMMDIGQKPGKFVVAETIERILLLGWMNGEGIREF